MSKSSISRRSLLSGSCKIVAGAVFAPLLLNAREVWAVSREAMAYTEAASGANQCNNCISYIPGATPDAMGECYILKGAINPKGYCNGWSAKTK